MCVANLQYGQDHTHPCLVTALTCGVYTQLFLFILHQQ